MLLRGVVVNTLSPYLRGPRFEFNARYLFTDASILRYFSELCVDDWLVYSCSHLISYNQLAVRSSTMQSINYCWIKQFISYGYDAWQNWDYEMRYIGRSIQTLHLLLPPVGFTVLYFSSKYYFEPLGNRRFLSILSSHFSTSGALVYDSVIIFALILKWRLTTMSLSV